MAKPIKKVKIITTYNKDGSYTKTKGTKSSTYKLNPDKKSNPSSKVKRYTNKEGYSEYKSGFTIKEKGGVMKGLDPMKKETLAQKRKRKMKSTQIFSKENVDKRRKAAKMKKKFKGIGKKIGTWGSRAAKTKYKSGGFLEPEIPNLDDM